ncbi:MAG: site-specific DNA-methyltransferase [Nitrosomonas sp.]|nr:site-specific DNA-methyltransferase [Nitrosomonas sp.]
MKEIPDKSVDMVFTDPPYGTTACKWDVVIPFDLMWEQLKRITKDNGAFCLFGSEPFSSHLRLSNLKMFKYDWYLEKNCATGFLNAKKMPLYRYEICSVFGKKLNYYPQLRACRPTKWKTNNTGSKSECYGGLKLIKPTYEVRDFTYPDNKLEFKQVRKNRLHPTQKPVELLEYLIKTYTLENETVLDFTMGSGSTGVACANLKRSFIGIEKDEKYFKIASERIGA